MKQRAISAAIFVVAMLGGVFGGATAFYILFGIITVGALWEFGGLVFAREQNHLLLRKISTTALGALPFLIFGGTQLGLFSASLQNLMPGISGTYDAVFLPLMLMLLLVSLLFVLEMFLQSAQPFGNMGFYLTGAVYVGLPMALLTVVATGAETYSPLRVLGLLLLTWANDTMAYLIGSQIGKTPFFARISPKKTWEGTLGGMVCTLLLGYLFARWMPVYGLTEWLVMAALVAVFGTVGDLVESMLKRSLQVKDSGSILPGHGGFLDRFDSFIFVLPYVWLALTILAR